ncbi:MAG: hypothetical protein ACRCUT_02900, partial [Spirochaetota bacterium]
VIGSTLTVFCLMLLFMHNDYVPFRTVMFSVGTVATVIFIVMIFFGMIMHYARPLFSPVTNFLHTRSMGRRYTLFFRITGALTGITFAASLILLLFVPKDFQTLRSVLFGLSFYAACIWFVMLFFATAKNIVIKIKGVFR